jgi:hypothetical protein
MIALVGACPQSKIAIALKLAVGFGPRGPDRFAADHAKESALRG